MKTLEEILTDGSLDDDEKGIFILKEMKPYQEGQYLARGTFCDVVPIGEADFSMQEVREWLSGFGGDVDETIAYISDMYS